MTRRWVVLALVFCGIVINYVDRGNISIAAPAIMREFRVAPGTMGVILSTFFWTYCICQIPAGAVVDRLGIRWSYTIGFLVWCAASAAIALSRGPGDIMGLRLVLGLAESVAPLASVAFIRSNFAGKDQGLPTSIYISGQNVGPALAALVGAFLVERFGWRMMFAITGLGGLLWLPFWVWTAPTDATSTRVDTVPADDPNPPRLWTWPMLLSTRTFWAMTLCILMSSYYWYFVLTWIPSYLILARGFSTLAMGRTLSVALFTMAVVNVAAGAVADRMAARLGVFPARVLFAAAGYVGTAAILLVLVTGRSWALPILTFAMCATGIGNSNYWALSQHVPPRNMVGRTIGYLNTVSVTAGIAAPLVTGYILGPQRHFGPAIVVAGACPLLAALFLLLAGPRGLERVKAIMAGSLA